MTWSGRLFDQVRVLPKLLAPRDLGCGPHLQLSQQVQLPTMNDDGLEHSESMRLQLQQAVETFRVQMSLLVQIWGFLIAADAILLGYALVQHKAVLLLAASGMPILMFLATRAMYLHGTPLLYVAVRLERELMPSQDTLALPTAV